jgi:hypothetical protein
MQTETQELTHRDDFSFIVEVIQRGRIKPAKFIHSLTIPYSLYQEMRNKGIIKPENYYTYDTAFFEFRHERVIISFVARCLCDNLQFVIDRYLIVECMGKYPIVRTCQSKMNNDKTKEPVVTGKPEMKPGKNATKVYKRKFAKYVNNHE